MPPEVNRHVSRLNEYLPLDAGSSALFQEYVDPSDHPSLPTGALKYLQDVVSSGSAELRLLVLTGDAGHGKTHLCAKLGTGPAIVLRWSGLSNRVHRRTTMATATKQPATDQRGPEKPTPDKSVGIAEIAEHLGTDPRSLRAFLRRTNQAVGRGTSYSWPSLNDPTVERLRVDWEATKAEKSERPSTKK